MAERRPKLYTIGYQDADIDEFADFLAGKGIDTIADVRKNPVSRKKGFSKNKLAARLAEDGISYLHFPNLGVPREWREKHKIGTLGRSKMFDDYAKKILPRERADMNALRERLRTERVALLCFETEAADCHRRRISEELRRLERNRLDVIDLEIHPASTRAGRWLKTPLPPDKRRETRWTGGEGSKG